MSISPHPNNSCAGKFQDWLDVMLTPYCNGNCSWCVDKNGYHPEKQAEWEKIASAALNTGRKNIVLLGGEPTLHPNIEEIIDYLHQHNRNVYITTNGWDISPRSAREKYANLDGINISIHCYLLHMNQLITGINLDRRRLCEAIKVLKRQNVSVRLNCNMIRGYMDSGEDIYRYIGFARDLGVDEVKFSELQFDEENFISLNSIYPNQFGLSDDPFVNGCSQKIELHGTTVILRQMCGLKTQSRPQHKVCNLTSKQILYYDGNIYNGWPQRKVEEMSNDRFSNILNECNEEDEETTIKEINYELEYMKLKKQYNELKKQNDLLVKERESNPNHEQVVYFVNDSCRAC